MMGRKIVSLICILCILFSTFAVSGVYGEENTVSPVALNAKEFLSQLNINKGIIKGENELITRAEFAAMVARILNIPTDDSAKAPFKDISENEFEKEINLLYQMGITGGTAENTFTPDGFVSKAVAAKMLVSAMEYDKLAQAMGGFPAGYLTVANEHKLFKNVSQSSDALTVGSAYIMVYNALVADKAVMTGVSEEEISYKKIEGRNILTDNFSLQSIKGIITTAGFYGVNEKTAGKGKIGISNKLFDTLLDTSEYLGKNATIWYDEEKQEVFAVYENTLSESEMINPEDVLEYSDYVLGIDTKDGKTKRYTFDRGFTYIENGRGEYFTFDKIKFSDGSIKLLDNDGDGDIDFVFAEKISYFVASSIDYIRGVMYDPQSDIKEIKEEYDNEHLFEMKMAGADIKLSDIKKDMVLSVIKSDDGDICKIDVSAKTAEGTLEEISEDIIKIGSEEFKLNSYFTGRNIDLKVGVDYKVYLASDNTVAFMVSSDSALAEYAFFLGYEKGNTLDSAKIKVLKEDNTIAVLELDKKIKLNATTTLSKGAEVENLLLNGDIPLYQLIKYKEVKGVVTLIDTEEKSLDKWDFESDKNMEDSLTKYVENKNIYYYGGGYNYGSPGITFAGALIIRVPENFDDGVSVIDDEEFFVTSYTSLESDIGHNIDVYDFDSLMTPAVILIREKGKVDDVKIPPRGNKSYIVTDLVDAIDEEGEKVKKIKLFYSDAYEEHFIKSELYNKMKIKPEKGDVIRYTRGSDGYIDGLCIDVKYTYLNGKHNFNVYYGENNVQTDAHHYFTYYTGNVYNATDNALLIDIIDHPGGSYWYSIPGGIMRVGLISPVYMEYNVKTGEVKAIKASMLKTIKNSGEGDAHAVVCRMVYGCANTIVAYID